MPFETMQGVRLYRFETFPPDVTQAVFTRQGGYSPQPWDSLNVGGTVGDDPEQVRRNRELAFTVVGRAPESLYDVWQVHSADVVTVREARPRGQRAPELKADAMITDNPDVTLFMRFADCTPILLYDPLHRAVGIVHSGWMGTVRRAVSAAVKAMTDTYRSDPANIMAAIGPAIGPDHYEVGLDVANKVRSAFGREAEALLQPKSEGKFLFNLWEANRTLLLGAGVKQIELAGLCTACHTEDWYSHRAEHGKTGRFGALIALTNGRTATGG